LKFKEEKKDLAGSMQGLFGASEEVHRILGNAFW
jgi:hypothetical protein